MKRLAFIIFFALGFSALWAQTNEQPLMPSSVQKEAPKKETQKPNSLPQKESKVQFTPLATPPAKVTKAEFDQIPADKQAFILKHPERYELVD